MGDLISREVLMRAVEEFFDEVCVYDVAPFEAVSDFENILDSIPYVDAEPVRRGVWIECLYYDEDGYTYSDYKCSECGRYEATKEPYCHCGAKMKEEGSNE